MIVGIPKMDQPSRLGSKLTVATAQVSISRLHVISAYLELQCVRGDMSNSWLQLIITLGDSKVAAGLSVL